MLLRFLVLSLERRGISGIFVGESLETFPQVSFIWSLSRLTLGMTLTCRYLTSNYYPRRGMFTVRNFWKIWMDCFDLLAICSYLFTFLTLLYLSLLLLLLFIWKSAGSSEESSAGWNTSLNWLLWLASEFLVVMFLCFPISC